MKIIYNNNQLFRIASFEKLKIARNLNIKPITNVSCIGRWVCLDWYYEIRYPENIVRIDHPFISAN